jgi:hypothetical protein
MGFRADPSKILSKVLKANEKEFPKISKLDFQNTAPVDKSTSTPPK